MLEDTSEEGAEGSEAGASAAEEPATEKTAAEDPTVEDPTVEDPTVEDPTIEDPTVEDPTVGEPAAGEPPNEVQVQVSSRYLALASRVLRALFDGEFQEGLKPGTSWPKKVGNH